MYLRLAFAVAAHLEPEILIVDEVLAVGELEFQRKCLGRMREVSQDGRTVLLVSHNMVAVESLCRNCIMLDAGEISIQGATTQVTHEYRRRIESVGAAGSRELTATEGLQTRHYRSVTLLDEEGEPTRCLPVTGAHRLRIGAEIGHTVADAQAFWRARLGGFEAPTQLNVDRTDPEHGAAFEERRFRLVPELTRALREQARANGVPYGTLLQAIWALLLALLAGEGLAAPRLGG
jgi:hypothetical protein